MAEGRPVAGRPPKIVSEELKVSGDDQKKSVDLSCAIKTILDSSNDGENQSH
jgi:hypothetical protein